MTNMKLQQRYYYNNLISIILHSIVMKNMKQLFITMKNVIAITWPKLLLSIICNLLQSWPKLFIARTNILLHQNCQIFKIYCKIYIALTPSLVQTNLITKLILIRYESKRLIAIFFFKGRFLVDYCYSFNKCLLFMFIQMFLVGFVKAFYLKLLILAFYYHVVRYIYIYWHVFNNK